MALQAFSPPGGVTDLSERGRQAWSRDVAKSLTDNAGAIRTCPTTVPATSSSTRWASNWRPTPRPKPCVGGRSPASWPASPPPGAGRWPRTATPRRSTASGSPCGTPRTASSRPSSPARSPATSTCWPPTTPSGCSKVYREHVSPDVQLNDLMSGNSYQERNRWNRSGAMHMIQGANTLGAAVLLVAQATIVRAGSGGPHDQRQRPHPLRRQRGPRSQQRSADRRRRQHPGPPGARVTFDDPAGLYLDGLQTAGWETPKANDDPNEFWVVDPGRRGPRACGPCTRCPPTGATRSATSASTVGRSSSASQIAEGVSVKVVGLAEQFGRPTKPRGCADEGRAAADESELPSADELMAAVRSIADRSVIGRPVGCPASPPASEPPPGGEPQRRARARSTAAAASTRP